MSKEQRRNPRSKAYAKVLLEGGSTPGYLRDLSMDGCQLALLKALPLREGDSLAVTILPDEQIGVSPFSVIIRTVWTRSDPVYFLIGARIESLPEEEQTGSLKALIDYYR